MALCPALYAGLAVLNLFAAVLVLADKQRAQRGRTRIPERRFLQLAFLGGWPGIFLAQRFARHKTRKTRYLVPLVLVSLASLTAWLVLLHALGCV